MRQAAHHGYALRRARGPWHLSLAAVADGAFTKGSQWLIWKFESDSTLGDALDGRLGAFPACLEVRTGGTSAAQRRICALQLAA